MGPTAEKGDVLLLEAKTSEGPRHLALSVIVAAPPGMLSFLVRSDEADILDKGIEQVSFTFGLEPVQNDVTDLYLASHFDSNSPFAAILSQAAARHQRERRLAILEIFRVIAEEAARLKYPPLHEVPLSVPPPPVYKNPSSPEIKEPGCRAAREIAAPSWRSKTGPRLGTFGSWKRQHRTSLRSPLNAVSFGPM